MKPFHERLAQAVSDLGNPVVVGLDPRWEQLPHELAPPGSKVDVAARAAGYVRFCQGVIDAVASLVPAVKPQVAFFEALGPPGMAALAEVIRYARDAGLLVIADAKRGDIGSTAEAYADAYLGSPPLSAWGADALTVNPYLGADALEPFVHAATSRGAGLFVLVKTSNPGGRDLQDLKADGLPIYRHVAEMVNRLSEPTRGKSGYGDVGAVVGATYPEELDELRRAMPHVWLLVPGYGSQGATASEVATAFDKDGLGALVNSSRAIIFAYGREPYASRLGQARWQEAVEAAAREMIEELNSVIRRG